MALALLLRSSCRNQAIPLMKNLSRTSTSFAIRPIVNKSMIEQFLLKKPVQQVIRPIQTTAVRQSAAQGGSHVTLWTIERGLSVGLLALIPVAFIFPSPATDALLAVSIVMHQHWGLEAIVTDYVRPIIFGNTIPKVAHGILILFSAATLAGLFYFIHNDIGIVNSIKKLWAIKGKQ